MAMFDATLRSWNMSGTSGVNSSRLRCSRFSRLNVCPSKRIRPLSADNTPASMASSVDFPAPFSPSTAMIELGGMLRSTRFSAVVSPNRLERSLSSMCMN